ncbi:GntP family permease [Actinomadura madurae]|nr:GntP family permease [Actinomadura madurae]MCP9955223.1 GntP family permease [Actinomadura madurae]MCQ0020655.1 GntP family permease [Actinomadura madurae]
MHGLVPPHPGPLVAIDALKADLGITLGLGVLVALPTIALSGPVFARYASRWVDVAPPQMYVTGAADDDEEGVAKGEGGGARRSPSPCSPCCSPSS